MKKIFTYIVPVVIAIVVILLVKPYYDDYKLKQQYDFKVSTLKGDITLDDFKGKVLAVYFGYTYCPDVCPTSLSRLSEALKGFSEKQLESFNGLFISVDPNRDKVKSLDEYAKYFNKRFIGATSNKNNIDDITKRYGTYYKKVYLENSSMDYSVAHTSFIYIFNKDGKLIKKVDHFSDEKAIKKVLKDLL